ncbi:NAD(+) synthase [Oribacterium sp. WCC10]|uniref:NAD(+) synthase n=1 Tax=Oribacterium sp. WCC10 TaxID=1855343 RepID=UPI0008F38E10|nr:NAD(+) synthase [Oribacterium sp. WCC10]SFG06009.1 NAD+ synthase (glutamine-hydrolysing) [Oribacterium sp. WCC10]
MIEGYIRVASATPKIKVADVSFNKEAIINNIEEAEKQGVKLIVFPELTLTAYTCADLFHQTILIEKAGQALDELAEVTEGKDMVVVLGTIWFTDHKLYNCAVVLHDGRILAVIPKKNLPNYGEFYERRWFTPGHEDVRFISHKSKATGEVYEIPFGTNILLEASDIPEFVLAAEICEDVWVPNPPSTNHALAGATVIANTSASDETVGKDSYRRELIRSTSARLMAAYVYTNAGDGESTTDLVFGGQDIIAENGSIVKEGKRFETGLYIADIDLQKLVQERARATTYPEVSEGLRDRYKVVEFTFETNKAGGGKASAGAQSSFESFGERETADGASASSGDSETYRVIEEVNHIANESGSSEGEYNGISEAEKLRADAADLRRFIDPKPFVPGNVQERTRRCEEIFTIQALGLKKRLEHIGCKTAVIGISGGLDSTLALLVTARAFDMLGLPRENIISVTMPAFGTTDRTYNNAVTLTKRLHATLREVNIKAAVMQHFSDIGHDPEDHSVTYENSQARERTQILMDIANQTDGIVIGTGDLSELALGWATYNGDHMSMYAVNVGVPKTLVRYLVKFVADTSEDKDLSACLNDIFDTPVSPELLPPTGDGQISQKTEDLVGPYELHDFFLYQILRFGFSPRKVYALALKAFSEENQKSVGIEQVETYDAETIYKWLNKFYWRFFSQQFKRSCLPDGPKVGSVAVSPRGDLRMPSDAVVKLWIEELKKLS